MSADGCQRREAKIAAHSEIVTTAKQQAHSACLFRCFAAILLDDQVDQPAGHDDLLDDVLAGG
jgi:hypothetical protein